MYDHDAFAADIGKKHCHGMILYGKRV